MKLVTLLSIIGCVFLVAQAVPRRRRRRRRRRRGAALLLKPLAVTIIGGHSIGVDGLARGLRPHVEALASHVMKLVTLLSIIGCVFLVAQAVPRRRRRRR